jgi:hypothetical protein
MGMLYLLVSFGYVPHIHWPTTVRFLDIPMLARYVGAAVLLVLIVDVVADAIRRRGS